VHQHGGVSAAETRQPRAAWRWDANAAGLHRAPGDQTPVAVSEVPPRDSHTAWPGAWGTSASAWGTSEGAST
jgi:hypothetical protein